MVHVEDSSEQVVAAPTRRRAPARRHANCVAVETRGGRLKRGASLVREAHDSWGDDSSRLELVRPSVEGSSPIRLDVEVSLVSESQFFAGLSGDVFEGGLFIATYRVLPIGTLADIAVRLLETDLSIAACVRWTRDTRSSVVAGLGVAFVSLSGEARDHVERFCSLRAPLYHDP
jgi:Tfp pilus assembly protein PilZ